VASRLAGEKIYEALQEIDARFHELHDLSNSDQEFTSEDEGEYQLNPFFKC